MVSGSICLYVNNEYSFTEDIAANTWSFNDRVLNRHQEDDGTLSKMFSGVQQNVCYVNNGVFLSVYNVCVPC